MVDVDIDAISADVVVAAVPIHRGLGSGLLESVYEAFRADLIAEGSLVIEIKSVEKRTDAHAKQVPTYLRLRDQPLGLLVNFSGETMKEGMRRLVNNHRPSAKAFVPLRLCANPVGKAITE
jgi:hypothetical protein